MEKEIYKAVKNLPEELITQEIADAAIKEGNIELLNHLPHKYLTGDVIIGIITKYEKSYGGNLFELKNIPENLRSKEICEFAVRQRHENILAVPENIRNQTIYDIAVSKYSGNITVVPKKFRSYSMLANMVSYVKTNLIYLHLFPASLWNKELAYKGINSIYSETSYNYGRHGAYYGSHKSTDIKRVQMFLSYVPKKLKNKSFFRGLFGTSLSAKHIDQMTPLCQKDKGYYLIMARRDFSLIPERFYGYDIFMSALSEGSKTSVYDLVKTGNRYKPNAIWEHIFNCMDDAMADRLITLYPSVFSSLPEKFQTSERLISAIEKYDEGYTYNLINSSYQHLFTEEVCKAFVRKNRDMPELPSSVWTKEFVDYCMEHGTSFYWFKQMPPSFQTREMVYRALDKCRSNLKYALPELISLEQVQQIYRESEYYRPDIPSHFMHEFVTETGLEEKFFGGEVSLDKLREYKKSYTYCRAGHCFIAIYNDGFYNSRNRLKMTRRTPHSIRPEVVFDHEVLRP